MQVCTDKTDTGLYQSYSYMVYPCGGVGIQVDELDKIPGVVKFVRRLNPGRRIRIHRFKTVADLDTQERLSAIYG